MSQVESYIERLVTDPICGYHPDSLPATEPTALAAMALVAVSQLEAATRAAYWLTQLQAHRGSVGVTVDQGEPCWPTALALIVWHEVAGVAPDAVFSQAISQALEWLQNQAGSTQPCESAIGHDSTLVGWPWVTGTHSWIEPTAWAVLAMKVLRRHDHPRCREGVRLLLDRQLPDGGCNYGNTFALGQLTLPHLQPSAVALLALQQEGDDPRLVRSLDYLERETARGTGLSSLCYAALALRAHGRQFPGPIGARVADELEQAGSRVGSYYCALAVLALAESPCLVRTRIAD